MMILLTFLFLQYSHAAQNFEIYAYGEKPRLAKPATKKEINLSMARHEYETFIVSLPNIKSVDLIGQVKLTWKKSAPKVQFETYWLAGHNFKSSSFKPGFKAGEIADIPIPLSWINNETITPPDANMLSRASYLFELRTDDNASPGDYNGEISFKAGKEKIAIPVQLKIYDVQLPEKFSLKTSFGFAPWEVLKKHYGAWHKDELSLYKQYFDLALEHRIDLHKIYLKFPEKNEQDLLVDFATQTKPLYSNGMNVTDLPIPQEFKTTKAESPRLLKDIENFWKKMNASVVKNKLQDKTFVYFVDEPAETQLKGIGEDIRQIKQWAPDLKFMITTPYRPTLEGSVDIWCLNLFLWEQPTEKSPEFYKQRQTLKKEELWFYVGCNSHGCTGAEDIQNPDFVIDRASAYLRSFPWIALRYEATGILYYDTVYTYSHGSAKSPWQDNFDFTGYGEGGLFYPCTPSLGQCKTPQVIPALRLKILRDGLEDVEIVKMAQAQGFNSASILNKVAKNVRDFSLENADYEMAKREALDYLASHGKKSK